MVSSRVAPLTRSLFNMSSLSAAQLSAPMRDALYYLLTGEHWDRPANRTILALSRRGLVDLAPRQGHDLLDGYWDPILGICDPILTAEGKTVCKHLWPNENL